LSYYNNYRLDQFITALIVYFLIQNFQDGFSLGARN